MIASNATVRSNSPHLGYLLIIWAKFRDNSLTTITDHVCFFMTTVYLSSDDCFQQDNTLCYKAQILSRWFFECYFSVMQWFAQSSDIKQIVHIRDEVKGYISHHCCCCQQICYNCLILACQHGTKFSDEGFWCLAKHKKAKNWGSSEGKVKFNSLLR